MASDSDSLFAGSPLHGSNHSQESVHQDGEHSETVSSSSSFRRRKSEESGETPLNYYLVGIELYNFKSYHGRHIVGPFTQVTAIVGANGAGKSNLMDAISFALCMKSNKLRAKNMEHLVSHNGSNSINNNDDDESNSDGDDLPPPVDASRFKAYVKLVFRSRENSNHLERTIQRGILQNNNSEFKIDEQVCPNQEQYKKFLNRLGLDAKSKIFLLFQCTFDALVTKNPKEFTNIMEELSGSARFAAEYDLLKGKCSEEEQELHLLQTQKQNLQKSKEFVESLRKQHERNDDIIGEIEQIKCRILLLQLDKQAKEIEHSKEQLDEHKAELEKVDEEIGKLEEKKQLLKETFNEVEKAAQKLAREYRKSDLSLACTEKNNLKRISTQVMATKKRLGKAEKNKDELKKKKDFISVSAQQLSEQMEAIEDEVGKVTRKLRASGNLNIEAEQVDEFLRLKNEYQTRVANSDAYNSMRNAERDLNLKRQELAVYESRLADGEAEQAALRSTINTKGTIIEKLHGDIATYDALKKKEAANAKKAADEVERSALEAAKSDANLKKARDSLERTSELMKRTRKQEDAKQVLERLKKAYPGRVFGRFGSLCKPEDRNYYQVFATVAGQYQNAIIVDSFATVQEIMKQEPRSSYQTETFLALDTLVTRERHIALREMVRDLGRPMFDLLRKPSNILNIDKAIRFVIGNTVVCPDRDRACRVAYELPGITFNAISLQCGTYFKTSGEITATFGKSKGHGGVFDEEDYYKEEKNFEKLEKVYLAAQERAMKAKVELEPINAEIRRMETHQNIAKQHIAELEASIGELNEQIASIQGRLDEDKVHDKIAELEGKIEDGEEKLRQFEANARAIKQEVFGDFLLQFDPPFEDIEQFEAAFYNDRQGIIEERSKLQAQLNDLKDKSNRLGDIDELENSIIMWQKVIDEEEEKLQTLLIEECAAREKLVTKEEEYERLLEESRSKKAEQGKVESELKKVNSELNSALDRRNFSIKSFEKFTSKLSSARQARHDIYRKAYIDSTELPVDQDHFHELFGAVDDEAPSLEEEDDLIVDFTPIEELLTQISNTQDFHRVIFELEKLLKAKEGELQTLTLDDDVNLSQRAANIKKEIRKINQEIDKVRFKHKNTKIRFEKVKRDRQLTFCSFMRAVADNVAVCYKKVTQNDNAQAYLVPENSEEPYLGGFNYSCIAPGKKYQPMSAMSGGEKCLAAFAFIFAAYSERLPSFFIMDEIDQSLDSDNIHKLLHFIREQSERTQFIFISHKKKLIAQVDSLIGVTRQTDKRNGGDSKSKSFSLDLRVYDNDYY